MTLRVDNVRDHRVRTIDLLFQKHAQAGLRVHRIVMPRTTRRNYVQPQIQKTLFAVPASIRHHRQMRRHGSTLHLRFAALRFVGLYRKQSRERILNQTKVDHLKTRGKNLIWYQGSKYQLFPERTANGIRYPAIFDSADTITTAFGPPKNDRRPPVSHSGREIHRQ